MFKHINTCPNFEISFTVMNFTTLLWFTLASMMHIHVTKSCEEMRVHYN